MFRFAILLLCALPAPGAAQFTFAPAYPPVSDAAGAPLPLAWLGGLNAPQTQGADLDGDGDQDLFVFDRAGEVALALENTGDGGYRPAPQLLAGFPPLTAWVALRDYDRDGVPDLFTFASVAAGVAVYRGSRQPDGTLDFILASPALDYPLDNGTRTTIFVSSIDYPAFDDLDDDGDLDLLTFSVGGGYVEYYRNRSVEDGFGTDRLRYELVTDCWGGFFESGITTALDLASGPGACFRRSLAGDPEPEFRHSGSTLLTLDADGDGLKDILLGDISFEYLTLGLNRGSRELAYIGEQDPTWPREGTPVNIPFFPAAFHLDLDADGDRDLLAAPTQTRNVTDVNVGWYYENQGSDASPDFVFRDSQYLVRQTIDLGTGAYPAAFDYDADGRPDLVIGNREAYTGTTNISSHLRLYRNVTPPGGAPAFELVDDDFLDLVRFQRTTWAFAPTFGDLDGDGDLDALVGERAGELIYLENLAGAGQPARFAAPVFGWQGIDAGQFSKPAIADLDRDGLPDLVVGGFDGRIRYYRNLGTARTPAFDPDPTAGDNRQQLGGVNTNVPGLSSGYPTPVIVTRKDDFLLLTGNRAGTLETYSFTSPAETFTALSDTLQGYDIGGFSAPALADFDGDGRREMVVGNERGGVTYFTTDLVADDPTGLFTPRSPAFSLDVFPNPATDRLQVTGLARTRVQRLLLRDARGRLLRTLDPAGANVYRIDLSGLPAGVYTLVAVGAAGLGTAKFVRVE